MTNVHETSELLVKDGNEATTTACNDDIVIINNNNQSSSSSSRLIRTALAGFVFVFVVISMIGHLMSSSSSSALSSSLSSYPGIDKVESSGEVIGSTSSNNGLASLLMINDKDVMDIDVAKTCCDNCLHDGIHSYGYCNPWCGANCVVGGCKKKGTVDNGVTDATCATCTTGLIKYWPCTKDPRYCEGSRCVLY